MRRGAGHRRSAARRAVAPGPRPRPAAPRAPACRACASPAAWCCPPGPCRRRGRSPPSVVGWRSDGGGGLEQGSGQGRSGRADSVPPRPRSQGRTAGRAASPAARAGGRPAGSRARRPRACGCRPPRPRPARSAGTRLRVGRAGWWWGRGKREQRWAHSRGSRQQAAARATPRLAAGQPSPGPGQPAGPRSGAPYSFFSPVAGLRVKHTPAAVGAGAGDGRQARQPPALDAARARDQAPRAQPAAGRAAPAGHAQQRCAPVPELSFRLPYTMDCTLTAVPSRPRMRLISLRAGGGRAGAGAAVKEVGGRWRGGGRAQRSAPSRRLAPHPHAGSSTARAHSPVLDGARRVPGAKHGVDGQLHLRGGRGARNAQSLGGEHTSTRRERAGPLPVGGSQAAAAGARARCPAAPAPARATPAPRYVWPAHGRPPPAAPAHTGRGAGSCRRARTRP